MAFEIDLRSDTVTRPCPQMRATMAAAEVGDDVIGDDPTVIALQEYTANLLGKDAALYMPSGSMTNQIAVRLHCGRGDEFLCESDCHIFNYEQGAFAQLSGVVARTLQGTRGILTLDQLEGTIHGDDDHLVRTSMLTIENTHNRGGGVVQPIENVDALCRWARSNNLSTHLDGARLFNAVAASGMEAQRWCLDFDSVSVCFSKGLGAPVGSALVGSSDFIRQAKRIRKLFGGGMRQAGIIAAGALYAIKNNRERLAEDHEHAKLLAKAVEASDQLTLFAEPETNIVLVELASKFGTPMDLCNRLAQHSIGAFPFGSRHVRLVTHSDVTRTQIEKACRVLETNLFTAR